MFGLNLKENGIMFGCVTFLSSILLALAYTATTRRYITQILKKRSTPNAKSKEERMKLEASFIQSSKRESIAYSLFSNNLAFTLLFLTMNFWFLPMLPVDMSTDALYGVSVVVPAALIYLNTQGIINFV